MKSNQSDKSKTKGDFITWSDQIEWYLRRGIVILLFLLCLSQLVLQFPAARHWLTSTDSAEGVPYIEISH